MTWLSKILSKRRLRKDVAEAIVLDVLRGTDFSEEELQWLLVGGPERPLGDVFAGEHFLSDGFRRIRYVHFLGWLIDECGRCLNGQGVVDRQFKNSTLEQIEEAIDPLLDYLLNGLRFVFESRQGPGAAGQEVVRAFQRLPREKCGTKARKNILTIGTS